MQVSAQVAKQPRILGNWKISANSQDFIEL